MTREDKIRAFVMRLDGMTYEEIGNMFGVTGDNVRKSLAEYARQRKGGFACIFPGIEKWMKEHKYTVSRLGRELNIAPSRTWLANKLNGRTKFSMPEIKKILAFTGMTFEEAFGEEVELGGGSDD